MKQAIAISLLVVFACSPFPRDAASTSEHIEQTDRMRVGIVSGTGDADAGKKMAAEIARQYGAAVEWSDGPASLLVHNLDKREIDLVIGEFARRSPMSKEVSFSAAIGQPEPRDGKLPVLRFARKKGENRLITVTDKMVMR